MKPPATKQQLVCQHDNRSIKATFVPCVMLDSIRLEYQVQGEPARRFIELPKAMFDTAFLPHQQAIVTITITNVGMVEVPATPLASLNGHKL